MSSRTLSSRIIIGSTTYDDTAVIDMSLESNLVPGEEFTLGTTICNKFEFTIATDNTIQALNVMSPYIGLNINGAVEEVPLGVFNVDDVTAIKGNKKVVAYDNMIKFEKAYFSDLSYPAAIQSIANEICQKAGVNFISVLPNYTIDKIEGKTLREAIGIIAGICGGFARINRAGALEIIKLTTTDISITSANFFGSLEKADNDFTIKKVTAIKEDNSTISSGSGSTGEEITFSNNFITQTMVDTILTSYLNYKYRPIKITWQGNPAIDVGDKITITDIDNTVYQIPVMRLKLTYKGGLKSETSSIAKSDSKSEYNYKGSVSKKVENIVTEQANIKVLLADKANITDLTAATARISDLETNSATISQLNASNGRIGTLESNYGTINTLLAGNLTAANFQTNAIQAGNAIIAIGAIASAQIADLSANKLSAGTINTTDIEISGSAAMLKIKGNRLQVFDIKQDSSLFERISLGDVNGDASKFGLRIRGADGTTLLFDENGQTKEGFTDGYNKLDSDALDPAKIDISKAIDRINADGSKTIASSKILMSAETLDLTFSKLVNAVVNGDQYYYGTETKVYQNAQGLSITTNNLQAVLTASGRATFTDMGSAIRTSADSISSKVWSSDITSSINAIQIGGRNLIKNSTGNLGLSPWWPNVGGISVSDTGYGGQKAIVVQRSGAAVGTARYQTYNNPLSIGVTENLLTGDSYTLSGWYWIDSSIPLDSGANTLHMRGYRVSDSAMVDFCVTTIPQNAQTGAWVYFEATTKLTYDIKSSGLAVYISLGLNGYIKVSNYKFEKGSKATAWSPAPEDAQTYTDTLQIGGRNLVRNSAFDMSINSVTDWYGGTSFWTLNAAKYLGKNYYSVDYSAQTSGYVDLDQTIWNIKPNTKYTISFWLSGVGGTNKFTWYAVEKKADGTTGTSTYKDDQFQITQVSAWTKYTKTFTTLSDCASLILIFRCFYGATAAITMVKLEEGDKATDWTPAPEDSDIQLGGRNYYKATTPITTYNGQTYDRNNSECVNGFYAVGVQAANGILRLSNVITCNGYWTISFEMRGSQTVPVSLHVDICDLGETTFTTTGDNTWKKYTLTVNVTKYTSSVYNFVDISHIAWAYFYIRNIKIEQGQKATDWTPAPEDVQGQIDSAVTRISTAEQKITPDAIVSTVSKSTMSSSSPVIALDNTDANIAYVGSWSSESNANLYGGTAKYSATSNDYLQYSFVGTGVNLYMVENTNHGICEVFIDGVSQGTVDTYASSVQYHAKAFTRTDLVYGYHTVKVVVTGTKNASATNFYVELDYLEILNSLAVDASNVVSVINQTAAEVTISATKIALSGSVTLSSWSHASDVTKIDGGDIYTGSITAVQIKANSITGDKFATTSPNLLYDVDSFEQFSDGVEPYGAKGNLTTCVVSSDDAYHGKRSLKTVSNGTANTYKYLGPYTDNTQGIGWYPLKVGRYILSAYVKTTSSTALDVLLVPVIRQGQTVTSATSGFVTSTGENTALASTSGWVRVVASITITDLTQNPYLSFYIRTVTAGTFTVYWDAIQLEFIGPRTDYIASPFAPGGITQIYGNNIVTGTITADKIKGNTLTLGGSGNVNGNLVIKDSGGSNNVVEAGYDGIKISHSDGSYTKFEATGISKYISGTAKPYHYLAYVGETTLSSFSATTITLPAEFKGKDFQVITAIKQADGGNNFLADIYCNVSSKSSANGTFDIIAYARTCGVSFNKQSFYYYDSSSYTYEWLLKDSSDLSMDWVNYSYLTVVYTVIA